MKIGSQSRSIAIFFKSLALSSFNLKQACDLPWQLSFPSRSTWNSCCNQTCTGQSTHWKYLSGGQSWCQVQQVLMITKSFRFCICTLTWSKNLPHSSLWEVRKQGTLSFVQVLGSRLSGSSSARAAEYWESKDQPWALHLVASLEHLLIKS